jgi:uncharacterized protein YndB with AHSA1/START domain
MIKAEKSMVVNRSVEDVFAYVGDQTNAPRWQAGLVEVRRLTDGPPRLGTRHTLVRTFLGRRMEADNEYIAYVPGERITFKTTSGPMPLEASYLVEPTVGGTRLTSRIEMEATGFLSLAEPLIAAGLGREMDAAFRKLKGLLEAPSLPSPDPTVGLGSDRRSTGRLTDEQARLLTD